MSLSTITTTSANGFIPAGTYYDQVFISPGTGVLNVASSNYINFVFQGTGSYLDTLGPAYYQGAVSGFQAGDSILLEDVPSSWTGAISYDPTTESLNLLSATGVASSITIAEQVVGQYSTSSFHTASSGPGFVTITVSTPAIAPSVTIPTNFAQATVTAGPGVEQVVAPGINTQALPGQSLQFIDGTQTYDRAAFEPADSQLPMIYRFYETALDRAPDALGENDWNAFVNHGLTETQLADGFLNSAEFAQKFGTLSNTDFVTLLYENGLGRAPEPTGFANWLGELSAGADRAAILIGISQSPEAMMRNAQLASAGVFVPNG